MQKENMLLDAVKLYYSEIKDIPILTRENEKKLGYLVLEGNKDAVDQLIHHNLRLAFSIAVNREYDTDTNLERIQEANLGLIKAANSYDVTNNYFFNTYASKTIQCSLLLNRRDYGSLIRLPKSAYYLQHKLKQESYLFKCEFGREPTVEELAKRLTISKKTVATSLKSFVTIDSLEQMLLGTNAKDQLLINDEETPEEQIVKKMFQKEILQLLKDELSEKEKDILYLKYGLKDGVEHTFEEIGAIYGVGRSRICHIEKAARNKVKVKSQQYF